MTNSLTSGLALPSLLLLSLLSSASPSPQFYPLFHSPPPLSHPHQFLAQRRDSVANGNHPSVQALHHSNYSLPSHPLPHTLDPLSGPAAADAFKNDVPRQVYGAGPPPPLYPQSAGYPQAPGYPQAGGYPQPSGYPQGSGLPQIYRIDNLIIIANPPQPQPCIPQRPQYPRPPSSDDDGGLDTRLGDEPSKCTWAVVACCSPGNDNVRYNCFELLGCVGFFFDNSACNPKTVMAAAKAALEFYRSANNATSPNNGGGTNNGGTINNRI